jgi:hypothetical protein
MPSTTGTAWYAREGGARAADLTDLHDTPTDTVTSDAELSRSSRSVQMSNIWTPVVVSAAPALLS